MLVFAFKSERPGNPGNVFSNWYPANFTMPDRTYSALGRTFQIPANSYTSTEQGMMEAKALCFGEPTVAERIMCPVPQLTTDQWHKYQASIKRLGGPGSIRNYNDDEWHAVRYQIVKDLNRQKFAQNPHLLQELLDTGGQILAEGAPYDKIWGVGLSTTSPQIQNPDQWKGLNLLGKLLMELREELSE